MTISDYLWIIDSLRSVCIVLQSKGLDTTYKNERIVYNTQRLMALWIAEGLKNA